MKILNQTYRDLQQEVSNKTPVTDLRETTEFDDKSYLHLVQFINETGGVSKYESMKIMGKAFKQKVYEAVQNTFKTKYWDTHEFDYTENAPSETHNQPEGDTRPEGTRPEGTAFADLVNYLNEKDANHTTGNIKYAPVEVQDNDADGFVNHIYYDFDVIKRYMVLKDNYLQSEIDGLNRWLYKVDCYFTQTMKLYTTDSHGETTEDISVIHDRTENDTYCQMHIEPGNKISNEWICPATGNLVVFGWLDSSEALNNKAIPSCYCVIEANINRGWEIISAQPVIPAKSITYVGFNLPVKKDLIIRARTGFTCGSKSSQYSNDQDGNDTLSNSVPNGFRCLIFSNDNYKVDEDSIESEDQT